MQHSSKTRPAVRSGDGSAADIEAAEIEAAEIKAAEIDAWARHAAAANGFGDAAVDRTGGQDQKQSQGGNTGPGHWFGRPRGVRR